MIDALDAMTSDRPYGQAMRFGASKGEILRDSGSQFGPLAVGALLAEQAILHRVVESKCHATDSP